LRYRISSRGLGGLVNAAIILSRFTCHMRREASRIFSLASIVCLNPFGGPVRHLLLSLTALRFSSVGIRPHAGLLAPEKNRLLHSDLPQVFVMPRSTRLGFR
jgi:hypothetical protein